MARTKAADQKIQDAEGVALRLPKPTERYADGVPLSVPADASDTESKSGQTATTQKEES